MSNLSARLLEERKRLGLNQVDFGVLGGVSKWTQLNYEKGANNPDLDYLMKMGVVQRLPVFAVAVILVFLQFLLKLKKLR